MTIIKESGRGLDILYANAGVGSVGSLGEITWEEFMSTFNTNVGGMVFTVQKALPLLTKGSSVILCGSAIDVKAAPGMGVYAATKAPSDPWAAPGPRNSSTWVSASTSSLLEPPTRPLSPNSPATPQH